ncbi:MAG TPA: SDR family oxidoreductase, partial [Actinomycetota bacterium]|nr:SDR family oxidoreductase [Actinomycetota bacterium]
MVESRGRPARRRTSLVRALAGKKVLVTGVTGFLGQAVFGRLLEDVPETALALLIRPQLGSSGRQRLESLIPRPTFDPLRERVGNDGILAMLDERVEVIEGDFARDLPELPDDLDVVIHCAATVSFDPPIDEGFQTNL